MTDELCACGKPLHYANESLKEDVERIIARDGKYLWVVNWKYDREMYKVPLHYIKLHDVRNHDLKLAGFKRFNPIRDRNNIRIQNVGNYYNQNAGEPV